MSYILDALKKSQKQRRRGTVPDVLTVQEIVVQQPSGRRIWPAVAACIAGLSVLILIWFFGWRGPAEKRPTPPARDTGPVVSSGDHSPAVAPVASVPADGNNGPAVVSQAPDRAPMPGIVTKAPSGYAPETRERAGRNTAPADEGAGRVQAPKDGPAKNAERTPELLPPAENRIYRLQELPDQIRRTLPEFAITAFMYSGQASARMVRINGRLMREGDELPPGVRLQEITPEGVILGYQGYRFVVALK